MHVHIHDIYKYARLLWLIRRHDGRPFRLELLEKLIECVSLRATTNLVLIGQAKLGQFRRTAGDGVFVDTSSQNQEHEDSDE